MDRANRYNGDGRLRLDQRASYLLLNLFDNRRPHQGLDAGVTVADFHASHAGRLRELPGTPSPSRALSDLFWMQLPWAAFEQELGPLRLLDLGCGTGAYTAKFAEWSGQRISRYTGLDLHVRPEWQDIKAAHPFTEFMTGNMERLAASMPPDTNLIVSQSALEHVRDDEGSFDQIRAYVEQTTGPLMQIHLVPSAACLRLFLWHGYRQYTPRTLSAVSRPFAGSDRAIFGLGGSASNALHWTFITWPLLVHGADHRSFRMPEYRRQLEAAIAKDAKTPQPSPAFYALVIHTRPRNHVLQKIGTRGRGLEAGD